MAVSFIGSAESSAVNSGNVTVTHPGGVLENDIVLVAFAVGDDNVDYVLSIATADYDTNKLCDLFADDTNDAHLGVFWKRMGSTPDSNVVCTGPAAGGTDCSTAAVEHVWRGVHTTTPIDATTTTATAANSSVPDPPPITTTVPSCAVIAIGAFSLSDTSIGAPNTFLNLVDINSADTEPVTVGMASTIPSGATTLDPDIFTAITDTATCGWCAATVALRPQPAAAVGSLLFSPLRPSMMAALMR